MCPYLSLLELLLGALSPYLLVCCRLYCIGMLLLLLSMHIDIYMHVFSRPGKIVMCACVCACVYDANATKLITLASLLDMLVLVPPNAQLC